ncbi:MAG: phosphoribosylglycinamide formyltransferase [Candidatus Dormibacteraeota bacterium]|nr:phosphoribosylglycinamide formyltransferase [Candidatus Dormibacteraeota bacterium]
MTDRVTRVGVLVSGAGTNLDALLQAAADPGYPARVVVVVSNRPNAPALGIARSHGIPALAMPQSAFGGSSEIRDRAMLDALHEHDVQLVVCAGYDRILSGEVLRSFPDAILNIHPSLLPAFAGGMTAVEDALAYGVKVTGCTVQLLEPGEADGGPIVLQAAVPVEPGDDAATLRRRVHEEEWRILPCAVELWSTGRVRREGRTVRILEPARR